MLEYLKYYRDFVRWILNGKPLPPPHRIKQAALRLYQTNYRFTTLIESGTFMGEMIFAQLPYFSKIISIELSKQYFEKAVDRFKENTTVSILFGDSGNVLKTIVPELTAPALFWLDGHYSGDDTARSEQETPIMKELMAIFSSRFRHIILVDDARLFTGEHDYPTLDALRQFCASHRYSMSVRDDIIRLEPLEQ